MRNRARILENLESIYRESYERAAKGAGALDTLERLRRLGGR